MKETVSEIDKKLNAILGVDYNEETTEDIEVINNEDNEISNNEIIIQPNTTDLIPNENIISDDIDKDFEFARNNIIKLSNIGMDNIEKLSTIAKDSQTPRMFEVLSGLIKNISDINSNLVDMHNKKISNIDEDQNNQQSNINVNQAIICTGPDMLKRIKDKKRNI